MKKTLIASVAIVLTGVGGVLFWQKPQAVAQVNAESCTCSRPTALQSGARAEANVYFCVCPGMQCVVSVASAGASATGLQQSCR
jgi:hypothetical protein